MDAAGEALRNVVRPLRGTAADLDPLVERARGAVLVLLGEATHGTVEFHRWRAALTRRLVREAGFTGVVWEGDWPEVARLDRFVRGADAVGEALDGFQRYPAWLWRNAEVGAFAAWLRGYNHALPRGSPRVGVYGMDLLGAEPALAAVASALAGMDPARAAQSRRHVAALGAWGSDPLAYGRAVQAGRAPALEPDVKALLQAVRGARPAVQADTGQPDAWFHAHRNATLLHGAEAYYRALARGHVESWNLRDRHMADTLDAVLDHLAREQDRPRLVVWAHNSHVGDSRATERGAHGVVNLGRLVRERHGAAALLVGLSTHHGWVTASRAWLGPPERLRMLGAPEGSMEQRFHALGIPRFQLDLRAHHAVVDGALGEQLTRAIGVVYLPEAERVNHCYRARLADHFDAVVHLDETHAIPPLEPAAPPPGAPAPRPGRGLPCA